MRGLLALEAVGEAEHTTRLHQRAFTQVDLSRGCLGLGALDTTLDPWDKV